jgi:hypothetical protein
MQPCIVCCSVSVLTCVRSVSPFAYTRRACTTAMESASWHGLQSCLGCSQAHTLLTHVCCGRHTSVTQHSLHTCAFTLTYKRVCVSAVHRHLGCDGTLAHTCTLLQVPRCTKDLSGSVVVRCVRQPRWHITLLARTSQHTRSPCVSHSQPVSYAVIVTTDVQHTPSHDAPPCAYVDDVCSSSCVDATTVNN